MKSMYTTAFALCLLAGSAWAEIIDTGADPADVQILGQQWDIGDPGRSGVGYSVTIGDFNGDGLQDLATTGPSGQWSTVSIILGRAAWPSVFDLRSIPPDTVIHETPYYRGPDSACFGTLGVDGWGDNAWSTLGAGDVTGDGMDDLVIAGPCWMRRGILLVVPGRTTWPVEIGIDADTWSPAILGPIDAIPPRFSTHAYLGRPLTVSDVNGDGVADILAGASEAFSAATGAVRAGRAYVMPGPIVGRAEMATSANLLDGTDGPIRLGRVVETGYLSPTVPRAIVLGQPEDWAAGRVMIFDGSRLEAAASVETSGALVTTLVGRVPFDEFGHAVDLGDIDCSGFGDLLVAAFEGDGPNGTGRVDIFRDVAKSAATPRVPDLMIYGRADRPREDRGMIWEACLGDLDGDGFDDIIVGQPVSEVLGGTARNVGDVTIVWNRPDLPPILDLDADSEWQLTLAGPVTAFSRFGIPVETADMNGDGRTDLLVSSAFRQMPFGFLPDGTIDIFTRNLHVTTVVPEAGPDQSVDVPRGSADCLVAVTLDASGSLDRGGNAMRHRWYEGATLLAEGEVVSVTLSAGEHCIRLFSTSGGGWAQDKVHVTVRDLDPPEIRSLTVDPGELWPPNHRMRGIRVSVDAWDACTAAGELTVTLLDVTSNEPSNGRGDGDSEADMDGWVVGTADLEGELRAERSGRGAGREYSLTYTVSDAAGNMATATVVVPVTHDRSGASSARATRRASPPGGRR